MKLRLKQKQWTEISKVLLNLGQAIILFGLSAWFAPEVFNLQKSASFILGILALLGGASGICIGVIIVGRKWN